MSSNKFKKKFKTHVTKAIQNKRNYIKHLILLNFNIELNAIKKYLRKDNSN